MIVAIDPGTTESAALMLRDGLPIRFGKIPNDMLLFQLRQWGEGEGPFAMAGHLAIEMIASYGMPVGREVFETCVWIGKFEEASKRKVTRVYRQDVKLHLCGSVRAKDSNVRQALIDLYGGRDKAIGKKNKSGPLYGIAADVWAALAVAITYSDRNRLAMP